MAIPIIMPRQGQSVESCIISEWFVKKGDKIKQGDRLFAYETDKAAFEEEAKAAGTVLELFFQEGDDVPVLTNVCVIGEKGEDISQYLPSSLSAESESVGKRTEQQKEGNERSAAEPLDAMGEESSAKQKHPVSDKLLISPRARNRAEKIGTDIRFAQPSGPEGRILERDVRKLQIQGHLVTPAAQNEYRSMEQPVEGTGLGGRITTQDTRNATALADETKKTPSVHLQYEDVKLTSIRKIIARTMHESLSQMAQLTINTSFDATKILAFRKNLKQNDEKRALSNITLNDILVYAASRVLLMHPDLNAHFLGDRLRRFSSVHMGVAVDTDRGLMVPTLFDAGRKSLNEISFEAKKIAQDCRKGTINPDMLKDGTFTITNLGTLGIESFTPVINPPQTAILGVNTMEQKVRVKEGTIESWSSMSLSLTFDHRAVDGAPAARFLKDLTDYLEHFTVLLAKG